ncbi:MAG TPA: hypothetical protein VFA94_03240 [Acidimicrobiales bacterium]|nr:hypothetical protein [Acidimicrobiales bacterium]
MALPLRRDEPVPAAHRDAAVAFLDELRRRDPDGHTLREADDPGALARQAATTVVDAAALWQEALGGFYDVETVRRMLGRDKRPVSRQAVSKRHDLLALRTGSGRVVYPAFQFRGSTPLAGLADVLAALPAELVSRWTVASWLVSALPELDGERPIDVLVSGGTPAVVAAAREWAASLTA